MMKLLNFLGTIFIILLLGFLFYTLYSGIKYLGANAVQKESTSQSSALTEDKGLLSQAMGKAGKLGTDFKDKTIETGSSLKDKGKDVYNNVSKKLNKATEKLDQSVQDLKTSKEYNTNDTDEYSEADEAAEAEAAKKEADLKKSLADKKEELTAKGGTSSKSSAATKSKTTKSKSSSASTKSSVPKSYNKTSKTITQYYVIAGSFKDKTNALNEVKRFKNQGYPKAEVIQFTRSKNYNIAVDKNLNMDKARQTAKKLESLGIPAYVRSKKTRQ